MRKDVEATEHSRGGEIALSGERLRLHLETLVPRYSERLIEEGEFR